MSAGSIKYDDQYKPLMLFLIIVMVIGAWFFGVHMTYQVQPGRRFETYWFALLATPTTIKLWYPPLFALVYGFVNFIIITLYSTTHFGIAAYTRRLRGPKIASAAELKDSTREYGKKQLRLMGIPMPTLKENLHNQVTGSTGAGKSIVLADFLQSAFERKDRAIVIDPNGTFMSYFWKEGDVILNPFDARGVDWCLFNEIVTPYDVEQYAVSVIPKSPSTEGEEWNAMARTIVAEVMLKLAQLGKSTTKDFVYWLVEATNEDLGEMLAGTPAAGMFHGAEETLGSVRAVLTRYVTPHKFLSENIRQEEIFSIRDWLINGKGRLWITWREDMLPALKPLISCWIDVICASSLSSDIDTAETMHLIIDELDSLEKLNYLVQAATKSRKHKFIITTGIQSFAQLDETNGKNDALTLRNSFRNTVSMGISEMDTYTAKQISEGLGKHDVVRQRVTVAAGVGARASGTPQTDSEYLVEPSEIHSLPDLTGYLKLAGDIPMARVTMKYVVRPQVIEPLILIDGKWTTSIAEQRGRKFLNQGNANAIV